MKKAFIQLHIAVFLAGFTGILGQLIQLNEVMLVWYRLLFTAAIMWVLYPLRGKLRPVPKTDLVRIMAIGAIASAHWITFYGAIKYSNVSVALVCFSSIGFFTALLEPLISRQRIRLMELLLGLITIAGISVIFAFDTRYKVGIGLGVLSALLGALFPILNRRLLQRVNVETLLCWQQTGGFLFLSVLLPFYLRLIPGVQLMPTPMDLVWLMILVVVCSVIGFQFSSNALRRLSAFTVNLTYNLEPVYGIILAFVVLHENRELSNWFFIGFGIILSALVIHVVMLRRTERKLSLAEIN